LQPIEPETKCLINLWMKALIRTPMLMSQLNGMKAEK
jgi:hypothetical protein